MKYKIAVSGAAKLNNHYEYVKELAREVGREIARKKCVLVTGATSGAPYYAAQGFKEVGGFSVGFSPASSETAHLKTYRLPVDVFDVIVYTGFDYSGRNLLMTNAADGVIIISPEYNGGVPASLKNAVDLLTDEWKNKPVAFVPVSDGNFAGSQAIISLQFSLWKLGADTVPGPLRIPNIISAFIDSGIPADKPAMDKRASAFVNNFLRRLYPVKQ